MHTDNIECYSLKMHIGKRGASYMSLVGPVMPLLPRSVVCKSHSTVSSVTTTFIAVVDYVVTVTL